MTHLHAGAGEVHRRLPPCPPGLMRQPKSMQPFIQRQSEGQQGVSFRKNAQTFTFCQEFPRCNDSPPVLAAGTELLPPAPLSALPAAAVDEPVAKTNAPSKIQNKERGDSKGKDRYAMQACLSQHMGAHSCSCFSRVPD